MLSLLQVFFQNFFPTDFVVLRASAVRQNQLESLFSSVTQSCHSLWPHRLQQRQSFPLHHQLPELAQAPVYQVVGVIKPWSQKAY